MATTNNWSSPVVRDVIMQALIIPSSEALDTSFATSSTFNKGSALAAVGCPLPDIPVSS
jgi:hypothetical protein